MSKAAFKDVAQNFDSLHPVTEYTLNTEQCVQVAKYMYEQWQEAMKPPLFAYKSFPDWLNELASQTHNRGQLNSNKEK